MKELTEEERIIVMKMYRNIRLAAIWRRYD